MIVSIEELLLKKLFYMEEQLCKELLEAIKMVFLPLHLIISICIKSSLWIRCGWQALHRVITFVFWGALHEITKMSLSVTCATDTPQNISTNYNICDLSNRYYFSKLLIFLTFVT
jgi:hypothetical protein